MDHVIICGKPCRLRHRHSITESPTHFWWQNGPKSPQQTSHELLKKRALFPVQIVEYTDEGVKDRTHPALSAEVAHMATHEQKQTASDGTSLHSKGEQPEACTA